MLFRSIGDEPLQVLRRLPLHAGGDFFAEQFKEKVGHSITLFNFDRPSSGRAFGAPTFSLREKGRRPPLPPGEGWGEGIRSSS